MALNLLPQTKQNIQLVSGTCALLGVRKRPISRACEVAGRNETPMGAHVPV